MNGKQREHMEVFDLYGRCVTGILGLVNIWLRALSDLIPPNPSIKKLLQTMLPKIFESKSPANCIPLVNRYTTTMKTILNKLATIALLSFLAISPLPAQSPASIEADTNKTPAYSEALQKQKLDIDKDLERTRLDNEKDIQRTRMDNDKDLERTRLDNEKQMAINRTDKHWLVVHDLAWNSWVLFAIAIFFFSYLKDKRRHETIRLMIEKGTPITPELLDGLRKKSRLGARTYDPQGYLCWGITEVLVAIALLIVFPSGGGHIAGWIVLAVGVANLILWCIDKAHSNGGQSK